MIYRWMGEQLICVAGQLFSYRAKSITLLVICHQKAPWLCSGVSPCSNEFVFSRGIWKDLRCSDISEDLRYFCVVGFMCFCSVEAWSTLIFRLKFMEMRVSPLLTLPFSKRGNSSSKRCGSVADRGCSSCSPFPDSQRHGSYSCHSSPVSFFPGMPSS